MTATSARPARPTRSRAARAGDDTRERSATTTPDDVLIFEQVDGTFQLIGGVGRGASWAAIVSFPADGSLVAQAWSRGTPQRLSGPRAVQVAGPYHARHAVAVPVGDRHVVVLGSARPILLRDADLVRMAAGAVDRTHGVPADKLLTDELELVHTLRALMAYRPETVDATLRHIVTVAAGALSCEVATIEVELDGRPVRASIGFDEAGFDAASHGPDAPRGYPVASSLLAEAIRSGSPVVQQSAHDQAGPFGVEVASQMALPIGADPPLGAIALGHSVARPRGFTSLCQRIGRAVAEAAELLITQASAREQLAAERDLLQRMSGTDALTGVANLRAWNEAVHVVERREAPRAHDTYVLSCDIDGLKQVNDRFGHAAGDAMIRGAANILASTVRQDDLVARVGGDEFIVLLRDVDDGMARSIHARIRRAERAWRVTEHGLTPRLSIGRARVEGDDVDSARRVADARMYANKRRRALAARRRPAS
jgi:diguanylate cyclase (GGDEF)-like protein